MITSLKFIILCCLCVCAVTFCYFAYNQQWIIFLSPWSRIELEDETKKVLVTKKIVKRIFWQNDNWHTEETELLWSDKNDETLMHLITNWLTLLDEEKVMEKKVSLQSVVLSPSGFDAYCSFDRNPFNKNHATLDKLMWVEGLLKTIRDNGVKIQQIHFLVHHQPLHDFHLDFSNPWPLSGFLSDI